LSELDTKSVTKGNTIRSAQVQSSGSWETLWQDLLGFDVVVSGEHRSKREKMVHSTNIQAGQDDSLPGIKTDIPEQGESKRIRTKGNIIQWGRNLYQGCR
jgi:hypothetical protein